MPFKTTLTGNKRLEKLYKWLNFELPGAVLFGISFFYNMAFLVFIIAATIFTPYLIYVLAREKRYGWIIFFTLFVAMPGAASYYFFAGYSTFNLSITGGGQMLAGAIPMALYLFYCYFLKLSIPGMIDQ